VKVLCQVAHIDLEGDHASIPSVAVTCGRCGHVTESFGESDLSIRRCLVLLREECPNGENNFYHAEEEG
jgi:hypothetical protein